MSVYQSKVQTRLPYVVINTSCHPISYGFEVIADYCSNFGRKTITLRFWAPLLGGLGVTKASTVHLRLIGNCSGLSIRVGYVLIELFR